MSFQQLPKDQQLKIALELCKKAAEQGKDSFFHRWWYFDTNCISELVKLSIGGHSAAVHDFVAGRDVLLTSTSMQELRKVPNILRSLFRYVKSSNVKPDINDFIDLANCSATPYCERYYCEATFANILREYVKGRKPPTAFQLIKKTYKKGLITQEIYEAQRQGKAKLSRTIPLLEHTEIFNFTEMRSQIL
jgi:hypothetical protein